MQFIAKKRGYGFIPLIMLAVLALVVGVLNASAATPFTEPLEIDANANGADSNGCATFPPDDWECVFAGTDSADVSVFIGQDVEGPSVDASTFTGGGSKDENDISAGGETSGVWSWKASGPGPDKDDIVDSMAALYEGVTVAGLTGDQAILYLAADVFQNQGAATLGFWILKEEVSATTPPNFTGHHVDGDLLAIAEFTNGGSVSQLRVAEWIGGAASASDCPAGSIGLFGQNLCTLFFSTSARCSTSAVTTKACGEVNTTANTTPWPYQGKGVAANTHAVGHFLEVMINLTQLGEGEAPCLGSFLAETRASPSVNARLWDFALGGFNNCKYPDVTVVKTAVDNGGDCKFEIVVTAGGTGDSTAVVLDDTLDPRCDATLGGADSAACDPIVGGVLHCEFGTIAEGGSRTVTVEEACPDIDNTATVTSTSDTDTTNNSDSATDEVICQPPA